MSREMQQVEDALASWNCRALLTEILIELYRQQEAPPADTSPVKLTNYYGPKCTCAATFRNSPACIAPNRNSPDGFGQQPAKAIYSA